MNFDTAQREYDRQLPVDQPEPRRSNEWIDDKVDDMAIRRPWWPARAAAWLAALLPG